MIASSRASTPSPAQLTAESYRFDDETRMLGLLLKHYGEVTFQLSRSAHASYVLANEDGTPIARGELTLPDTDRVEPGRMLHASGEVGSSPPFARLWARVRPRP